ncbi:MAG: hypothetical protein NWF08_01890 [Candidatus Bathyarchaeota archaeon]|nr:hypothetical protein [Candidatus Bathyarchaeota archaeon]
MKEKNKRIILDALKKLEIPSEVEVVLEKTKKAPLHGVFSIYDYKIRDNNQITDFRYIIRYKKSITSTILRQELCHLKLYLSALPTFLSSGNQEIISQILDILHEDFYVGLISALLFHEDYASNLEKILKNEHVEEHFHEDDNSIAWMLKNCILNKAICKSIGFDDYYQRFHTKSNKIFSLIEPDLSSYLKEIEMNLDKLPIITGELRPLNSEERDAIISFMFSTNEIGKKILKKIHNH